MATRIFTKYRKQPNFKIYVHINKKNGKCYVGQTRQTLKERWGKNGYRYTKDLERHYNVHEPKFANAIQKYGWDNFDHVLLKSRIRSKASADKWERHYVKYYDSYENGYNLTEGGDGTNKNLYKTVFQLRETKNGNFVLVHRYDSIRELSRRTGYTRSSLRYAIDHHTEFGGYYWSVGGYANFKSTDKQMEFRHILCEYEECGVMYSKKYKSMNALATELGCNRGSVKYAADTMTPLFGKYTITYLK